MNPPYLVVLRCYRDRSGHGPHEARQLTGHSHGDHVGVLASGDESSVALTEPDLGFPTDLLDDVGWLFASQLQMSAHLGGVAIRPGAFDKSPSGMGTPAANSADHTEYRTSRAEF